MTLEERRRTVGLFLAHFHYFFLKNSLSVSIPWPKKIPLANIALPPVPPHPPLTNFSIPETN